MNRASYAQKRIFFQDLLSRSQNITYRDIELDQSYSIQYIIVSISLIMNRHQALRTYFILDGSELIQRVVDLDHIDLNSILDQDSSIPFEFMYTPYTKQKTLFRISQIKNSKIISFYGSHICIDGFTVMLFEKELLTILNKIELSDMSHYQYIQYTEDDYKYIKNNQELISNWIKSFHQFDTYFVEPSSYHSNPHSILPGAHAFFLVILNLP